VSGDDVESRQTDGARFRSIATWFPSMEYTMSLLSVWEVRILGAAIFVVFVAGVRGGYCE